MDFLAHSLVVLIKLAFARMPGLHGFPLRKACNVPEYLDRLGNKVGALSTTPFDSDRQDAYAHFRNSTQTLKAFYERVTSLDVDVDASAEGSGSGMAEPGVGGGLMTERLPGMNPMKWMDLIKEESFFGMVWRDLDLFFP